MKQKQTTFYCFSPLVMFLTFVIEIGLFLYVLFRYKASQVQRLALVTLIALATFQLAEYNVCTSDPGLAIGWSRLGFAAITLLPPLGIHLAYTLAGKKINRIILLAYGTAAMWVSLFLFDSMMFNGHVCTGNYVIFQMRQDLTALYILYYYGWLLGGVYIAHRLSRKAKLVVKRALKWQVLGYAVFIVPTTLANIVEPSTRAGIPSIMCGFAIFFAIILGTRMMRGQKRASHKKLLKFIDN